MRPGLIALAVVAVVLLSACRVDATLRIDVDEDGSGTLTLDLVLDADAVAQTEAGAGTLEERVRLSNLAAAGWELGGWERADDGSAAISLVHAFATPGEAGDLVADLNGAGGPVPELSLTRDAGFFQTELAVTGVVDLGSVETGIANDEELSAALEANGVPVGALETRLLEAARSGLAVTVEAAFPGGETVTAVVEPGERAALDGESTVTDTRRIVLVASAGGLVALAVLLMTIARPSARRRARSIEAAR